MIRHAAVATAVVAGLLCMHALAMAGSTLADVPTADAPWLWHRDPSTRPSQPKRATTTAAPLTIAAMVCTSPGCASPCCSLPAMS